MTIAAGFRFGGVGAEDFARREAETLPVADLIPVRIAYPIVIRLALPPAAAVLLLTDRSSTSHSSA